jgi:hypothetical protein
MNGDADHPLGEPIEAFCIRAAEFQRICDS